MKVPFYASLDEVRRISKLTPNELKLSNRQCQTSWDDDAPWQVVPLEDGIYVRGWQQPGSQFQADSRTIANNERILLSEPVDSKATTRTVPIESFRDIRDPKLRFTGPEVDGTTYADRHAEVVEIPRAGGSNASAR